MNNCDQEEQSFLNAYEHWRVTGELPRGCEFTIADMKACKIGDTIMLVVCAVLALSVFAVACWLIIELWGLL